jgi:hypothetical protein
VALDVWCAHTDGAVKPTVKHAAVNVTLIVTWCRLKRARGAQVWRVHTDGVVNMRSNMQQSK